MKSASFPSARPPLAKRASSATKPKTDWVRLMSTENGKATVKHPEFDPKHVVRGIVRRSLKPVASKELISLRTDQDVIEWFKARGPGYHTRINSVLRTFRDAPSAGAHAQPDVHQHLSLNPDSVLGRPPVAVVRRVASRRLSKFGSPS